MRPLIDYVQLAFLEDKREQKESLLQFKTEQENFWAGEFGDQYMVRNRLDALLKNKIFHWKKMLQSTHGINSVFEFGCNEGLNLRALRYLNPDLCISAIDINKNAVNMAKTHGFDNVHQGSIIEPMDVKSVDLTFTTGVLIHINPEYLVNVYDNLVQASDRYIIVSEYYSPNPVSVTYRGHENSSLREILQENLLTSIT